MGARVRLGARADEREQQPGRGCPGDGQHGEAGRAKRLRRARDEGHADAGGHQGGHRVPLAAVVLDVRREPGGGADPGDDVAARVARRGAHPHVAGQLVQVDGGPAGERVPGRDHRVHHVGDEVHAAVPAVLARRGARVVNRHGNLQLARVEQVKRLVRFLLADPDDQPGAVLAQPDDGRADQRGDPGRQGADPDVAHGAVGPGVQGGAGPLREFPHALGVREQQPRLAGQHDGAAAPFEQRHADVPGQAGQLLRHRGRGQVQRLGRGRDRPAPVKLGEQLELSPVNREVPANAFHENSLDRRNESAEGIMVG